MSYQTMTNCSKPETVPKKTEDLFRNILSQLRPPPNIPLAEWADRYRYLSDTASAEPGRWRTSRAPYQRELMNAISDKNVRKVVAMWGAQSGKTDCAILNTIGYHVHYDPAAMMVMDPTLEMGEKFSKTRLSPMIRDTPVISERIDDRSRVSGNTIMNKLFAGGYITIVGANSPASLAAQPVRILLADEIDRYPATAGDEGDPLFLAEQRTKSFWNRKTVITSTPTVKGSSRIESEYEHSTMGVWNIPCPGCGEMNALEWGKIVFDSERFRSGEDRSVLMQCGACGEAFTEPEWKAQSIHGTYIEEHPERETKGFYLNSLASTFSHWEEIVEKFLLAKDEADKGNTMLLKSWTNTEMAQTWEEEGETLETEDLMERLEEYPAEAPEGVLFITVGVDTQDDRFEFEYVGWGVGYESWGLGYNILYGDMKRPEIWEQLDMHLQKSFEKSDGTILKAGCVCIDSGGHFTNEVYRFCKARTNRNVFAIKGRAGGEVPFIGRATTGNRQKTPLFLIGVDTGKGYVMDRLNVQRPGPGYCHFSAAEEHRYTEEYFKGLTAEKRVVTYRKGQAMYTWELRNKGYRRNEPFDIRDYATAAVEIANPNLEGMRRKRVVKRRRQISSGIK